MAQPKKNATAAKPKSDKKKQAPKARPPTLTQKLADHERKVLKVRNHNKILEARVAAIEAASQGASQRLSGAHRKAQGQSSRTIVKETKRKHKSSKKAKEPEPEDSPSDSDSD